MNAAMLFNNRKYSDTRTENGTFASIHSLFVRGGGVVAIYFGLYFDRNIYGICRLVTDGTANSVLTFRVARCRPTNSIRDRHTLPHTKREALTGAAHLNWRDDTVTREADWIEGYLTNIYSYTSTHKQPRLPQRVQSLKETWWQMLYRNMTL